jgi:signal transduction histidine kinase
MPDESIEYVGAWSAWERPSGSASGAAGRSNVSTVVFETGQPGRVDQLERKPARSRARARARRPLVGRRSDRGGGTALGRDDRRVDPRRSLRRASSDELAAFTELIATAIANAEARAELTASRARLVTSADETRRRIVRDLHDGAQSGLVQTIITLEMAVRAQDKTTTRRPATARRGAGPGAARQSRDCASSCRASFLPASPVGSVAAVEELIERLRVPVTVDVAPAGFAPRSRPTRISSSPRR